jgi:hypothetical protein
MGELKTLALTAVAGICLATAANNAVAQVNINIGPAPVCPYGYYDYAPYACAPYGYYGPEWFSGGVFISEGYAKNARFVTDLGAPVLELLAPRARRAHPGCGLR